jgi:hypothetical protein
MIKSPQCTAFLDSAAKAKATSFSLESSKWYFCAEHLSVRSHKCTNMHPLTVRNVVYGSDPPAIGAGMSAGLLRCRSPTISASRSLVQLSELVRQWGGMKNNIR